MRVRCDGVRVQIDHGYTVKFGSLCKDHGVRHFHLLTSTGANPNSWLLYPKTKGQVRHLVSMPRWLFVSCCATRSDVRWRRRGVEAE
jgi:hypothetical protein